MYRGELKVPSQTRAGSLKLSEVCASLERVAFTSKPQDLPLLLR